MLAFLNGWPNPNNLLKAVKEDLSNELFTAELRALGIIDKFLTGPLWRLIESKKSILDLIVHLFHLKIKIDELGKDASPLLNQQLILPELPIHTDCLYEKLFEDNDDVDFDVMTQQALEIILLGILVILEKQCVDQLPGGKYWNADDNIKKNRFCCTYH